MKTSPPYHASWLDPAPWRQVALATTASHVERALASASPGLADFAHLIAPAAAPYLEAMAQRALLLTRRHFGRTIALYAPLYLSNYCSGGCAYCGFASDRTVVRRRLSRPAVRQELESLARLGIDDVLLLTGERTPQAGVAYLRDCVAMTAERIDAVAIEVFPMSQAEYTQIVQAGAVGVTLYQETYDPALYAHVHRWGPKRDFHHRLEAPERALAAGFRFAGIGALLGLGDPLYDMIAVFQHLEHLMRSHWRAGVSVSFPRLRPEAGGWQPQTNVSDRQLAQFITAFRICQPTVPLVLSTREKAVFRDGMAGVGISRMSVASRTTVGGYGQAADSGAQFAVSDDRDVTTFTAALRDQGLEPVFKNWDASYRGYAALG